MTRAQRPSSLLRRVAFAALLALVLPAPTAAAAEDDFDFGRRLAQKGYFDYAKRLFEGMAKDEKRPAPDRARARYGLALLGKDEAYAARVRTEIPYAEVKAKFDEALKVIDDFASQNANDPRAEEALLEGGELRLGVTQWIGGLQKDSKAVADRKADKEALAADAKAYVAKAVDVFGRLRERGKTEETKQRAAYSYAMAQYYRGFAEAACSPAALVALNEAHRALEDYATANEQYLLGMYAMDFLGMTDWELAKCQQEPEKRAVAYNTAYGWFDACTQTENHTLDHTTIIARGFLHLAQLCLEARRQEKLDFLTMGSKSLARLKDVARVLKVPEGILAMIERAEIESERGNATEAFNLADQASDAAKEIGFDEGVRKANAALDRYAAGVRGAVDPDALLKLAENKFAGQKYDEAIPRYRQVIAASATAEQRERIALPAWDRIAHSYHRQELWFEAAAAWGVVLDAWRADPKRASAAEGDPKTQAALRAAQGIRDSLEKIEAATHDPAIRSRLVSIREEMPRLFPMVSSAQDAAYGQAIQFMNEAFRDRAAGVSGWESKLSRARAGFRETAQNVRSDRQDNAWAILATIENRVDAHDAAIKVADEALAYWETPPAKRRLLEEGDRLAGNRALQKSRVTLEKAKALVELGRPDDALPIAAGYEQAWPNAEKLQKQLALGLHVRIVLEKGNIEEAETLLKRLIQEYPGYFDLGRIVIRLAQHYESLAEPIQGRLKEIESTVRGTREAPGLEPRLNALVREESAVLERLSTMQVELDRQRLQAGNAPPDQQLLKQKALDRIAEIEPEIAKIQAEGATVRAKRMEVEAKIPPLLEERARLRRDLAGPLGLAARRYVEWDEAVKAEDAQSEEKKRNPDNVRGFAQRYYQLASLRPDDLETWNEVRRLYEEYFAFPEVQKLPDSDVRKRRHLAYLGEAYYHLAVAESDPEKARPLYEKATGNLEKGLARVAENTPLVVGLLAGELVTLPFEDPAQAARRFDFPVRRVDGAAAFKKHVAEMREADLPRYDARRGADDAAHKRALTSFKSYVAGMSEGEAKRAADSTKTGAFDPQFFAEHADATAEALLPLAKAYVRSRTKENAIRAMNAASTALIRGPHAPESGSPEWWEAHTVILNYYVTQAEVGAEAGGASAAVAADAKRADQILSSFKRMFPRIGGAERHEETLAEWLVLQTRLRAALQRLQIPETPVDLRAEAPPPPATPARTPTGPGAGAPAGAGAGAPAGAGTGAPGRGGAGGPAGAASGGDAAGKD